MTARRELVQSYYAAIDEDRYDDLTTLLAPAFVHQRPDRTFEGRETFVEFMRDERPKTETTHALDTVYTDEIGTVFAVRGRLLDTTDKQLFGFVDVHTIKDEAIAHVRTYTD